MLVVITPGEATYDKFKNEVRRFNRIALLESVANESIANDKGDQPTPPWTLAAVVRASFLHGNAHRHTLPKREDLIRCCLLYQNVEPADGFGDSEAASLRSILTRLAFEQFPSQVSPNMELARAETFFNGYDGDKSLEIISDGTLQRTFGASIDQAIDVAFLLHTSAYKNDGYFDLAWLDQPNFVEILEKVSRDEIENVLKTTFATTIDDYRKEVGLAPPDPALDSTLPQFGYNPLTSTPFIEVSPGRFIAPVPSYILPRLSPIESYYKGGKLFDNAYINDLGLLWENYVGRQLNTISQAVVSPEVKYGLKGKRKDSADWFVESGGVLLIVEAKAARFNLSARIGGTKLDAQLQKILGIAFDQINGTHEALLRGDLPNSIPRTLPVIGVVATLDSSYGMNGSFIRQVLPDSNVPILIASARELERLVAIGQRRDIGPILNEIITGEKHDWNLAHSLMDYSQPGDKNPLHETAWARLRWNK